MLFVLQFVMQVCLLGYTLGLVVGRRESLFLFLILQYCLGVFCGGCTETRIKLPFLGYNVPVRVCDACCGTTQSTEADAKLGRVNLLHITTALKICRTHNCHSKYAKLQ